MKDRLSCLEESEVVVVMVVSDMEPRHTSAMIARVTLMLLRLFVIV